jgi:hypothetical protein
MEAEAKVDLMLKGMSFTSESARAKTRMALLKDLKALETIHDSSEEDYVEDKGDYRYDDTDGVPCLTADKFEQLQDEKRAKLRKQSSEFFRDVDVEAVEDSDINARLKWGYTLLHFAAIEGNEAECDRLVAAGADLAATDNSGKMPYQKAALKGFDDLAEKLRPR